MTVCRALYKKAAAFKSSVRSSLNWDLSAPLLLLISVNSAQINVINSESCREKELHLTSCRWQHLSCPPTSFGLPVVHCCSIRSSPHVSLRCTYNNCTEDCNERQRTTVMDSPLFLLQTTVWPVLNFTICFLEIGNAAFGWYISPDDLLIKFSSDDSV